MGLFITFEGGEGVGKSTQARILHDRLASEGRRVLGLREPGGTPLGDYLRTWLKAADAPLGAAAELFLFTAARAELVHQVIQPALEGGRTVVLDRYADSTTVYQGDARGLPEAAVRAANELATGGLTPDLTILLDAPPAIALRRAAKRSVPDEGERLEQEAAAFHDRVRTGFQRLAERSPQRWLVLDAQRSIEEVAAQVWEGVERLLVS